MKYVFIPNGTEMINGISIDRRQRFFNIVEGVLNATQLKAVEAIEIAGWWNDKIVAAKNQESVRFLSLEDAHYQKLKDILFNFGGYNGLAAVETLMAFQNAVDRVNEELPQPTEPA